MNSLQEPFLQPTLVADYTEQTAQKVPGLADLHSMTQLLLSERAQQAAHILVVGAGGGMEIKAMANAQREWEFTGVDPSAAMLELARRTIGPYNHRATMIEGTIDAAPIALYDGATCLLTLHFLNRNERLQTLQEIRHRLKPGARLVVAHHSMPGADANNWLARSAAFACRSGVDWQNAKASATNMANRLPLLSVAEEEILLSEAGFTEIELFYAAFSFRGWVATAG
ncbi:class I SAM-dependent methyltransferase [Rheinheimera sp.]|uniref:class I SAM-dependent methyltransferase n=1 Tax=Rheinheimera sp. TaxID=1869214 RepID=UPI00273437E4|nr:class I SAM-dependent methyltransferase [Rheinheimera sp.]MDP2715807.1 class I SAM-dependent methyltransferase [Rheinheimera sp.]